MKSRPRVFDRITNNIFQFYVSSWRNDLMLHPEVPISEISSVRRIIEMGTKVIPLIKKETDRGCTLDWEYILSKIEQV